MERGYLIYIFGRGMSKVGEGSCNLAFLVEPENFTEYCIFGKSFLIYAKLLDFEIIYLEIFAELKLDFGWKWF